VQGHDVRREQAVKRLLGLVNTDERSFYWRLNARENLQFFAVLYGVPRERRADRIEELLERVDLREAAGRPFSGYSSGMKQRMAIARALLHDPPILLMDEPTRSLDPASQLSLRRFIADELSGRDRKTILLATHNLREAEALCDRIAIVAGGRIVEVGTVERIRSLGIRATRYRLTVDRWPDGLSGPFADVRIDRRGGIVRATISLDDEVDVGEALRPVLEAGVRVVSCERMEFDLEDAFSRVLEGVARSGEGEGETS
jgi:ABC-2 type transport system ATP-binding protein